MFGIGRPEILLEGFNEDTGVWHPIHFKFKPGNISDMPLFVSTLSHYIVFFGLSYVYNMCY